MCVPFVNIHGYTGGSRHGLKGGCVLCPQTRHLQEETRFLVDNGFIAIILGQNSPSDLLVPTMMRSQLASQKMSHDNF